MLYVPESASIEKLTIGVVRYMTQTVLLDMMTIGSPTITEGMKQTNPFRSSILILFTMSSLRLFTTAFRILMFRIITSHFAECPSAMTIKLGLCVNYSTCVSQNLVFPEIVGISSKFIRITTQYPISLTSGKRKYRWLIPISLLPAYTAVIDGGTCGGYLLILF